MRNTEHYYSRRLLRGYLQFFLKSFFGKVQQTVDLTNRENAEIAIKGRHDSTISPRMVPVAEARVALVLADHMLRSGFINPRTLLE